MNADRAAGEPITPRSKRTPKPRRAPVGKAVHVAPRRIGDGLKPNHLDRAVSIDAVFPRTSWQLPVVEEEKADA